MHKARLNLEKRENERMLKRSYLLGLIGLILSLAVVSVGAGQTKKTKSKAKKSVGQAAPEKYPPGAKLSDGRVVPPYYLNPDEVTVLPKTMAPEQFSHEKVRQGYQIAQDNPKLLMQLPCTCGCDRSDNHKSLLSCYTDRHGQYCVICLDEAILAAELHAQKVPISKIRETIIEKYLPH